MKSIDSQFTEHYRALLGIQRRIKSKLEAYEFDLSGTEITKAIVNRMWAFWDFNVPKNKEILGREVNSTAADFFTETCLLFLKAVLGQKGFEVFSEKKLPDIGKKPDVSIWKEGELCAVVELKVSDGWRGKAIMRHLEEREKLIKDAFPDVYFGVLAFWNFFDAGSKEWNKKYFGLQQHRSNHEHQPTDTSVEKLLWEILQHVRK